MSPISYRFTVTGMHCASCGMLIDESLEELPGVIGSQTSVRNGHTTVEVDDGRTTPDAIVSVIAEAGYVAVLER